MKNGFQVYIDKNLSKDERKNAIDFIHNKFLIPTVQDSKFRYFGGTGGGYTSGIWRGRFGIQIDDTLVFRRISKNQRKFGVVKICDLEVFNDKLLDKSHHIYRGLVPNGEIPNMCKCPRHKSSIKVRFKNDKKPDMDLYIQIGDYKG